MCNMNQKAFSEMTIGETRKLCETSDCAQCTFYNPRPGLRCCSFDEYTCYLDERNNEYLNELFIESETRVSPWLTDE